MALLDAALLERSLYLIAELLPLPSPVIVALNMMDVAEQEGLSIEPEVLEAALGVRVVPMIATKNIGTRELVEAVDDLAKHSDEVCSQAPRNPSRPSAGSGRDRGTDQTARYLSPTLRPGSLSRSWKATRRSRT